MRRHHVITVGAVALFLAMVTAAAATAADAEVIKDKTTYELVDGVPTPYIYEGDYGFEQCWNPDGTPRTYSLHDGTLKLKATYTYTPSQATFESGEPGASMTAEGKYQFKGLFDRNDSGEAIYELKPQSGLLRGVFSSTINADGTVSNTSTYDFTIEFMDTTTGLSTGDYYNVDGTLTEVVARDGTVLSSSFEGVNDGTCGLLE